MNRHIFKIAYLMLVISLVGCSSSRNMKERKRSRKVVNTSQKKTQNQSHTSKKKRSKSGTTLSTNPFIAISEQLIGIPYKYGGRDKQGLDCSGLVRYVYNQAGYPIQGSSKTLAKQGEKIRKSEVEPGDLVFFAKNGEVFHVSLVVENKRNDLWVVHSTSSKGVIKENIFASPYWNKKSISYRRILK